MTQRPLCFVAMPFGKKPTAGGTQIDFDEVYRELIAPAIEEAGFEPLRADEEMTAGIIHKPMFERLILCEYAIADLTTANANVFYELGVRHAVRPCSTVLIFAKGAGQLPFDVAPLRALPYEVDADGTPVNTPADRAGLTRRLVEARRATPDSPLYQLVEGFPRVDYTKTDVFRDRVEYAASMKERLARARKEGIDAVRAIEAEIGNVAAAESGIVIDLFLSYRAVRAWAEMIVLVEKMAPPLAATVLVREQLALALNRAGQGEKAERVLLDLLAKRGPSSETYGILGRVYKDRWEEAVLRGDAALARGLLGKAIDNYLRGFEADWREAYPGINAVTLMELKEPPDSRRADLIPVVRYALARRLGSGTPGYWDHASRLELAALTGDQAEAEAALGDALAAMTEPWEAETTARNLRLIGGARERRGMEVAWLRDLQAALESSMRT